MWIVDARTEDRDGLVYVGVSDEFPTDKDP